MSLQEKIESLDWPNLLRSLDQKGYILIPEVLSKSQCHRLKDLYDHHTAFRKTVLMEKFRFGQGEYKYFEYPLPDVIQTLRESIYPYLADLANNWMQMLKLERQFPDNFIEFQAQCHQNHQNKATVLLLRYGKGGYNTLHQDLYGEVYFPFQLVYFLDQFEQDYSGGEFVMTEQVPRAQSKAMVIKPNQGDMLIFATNFRPVKGKKGYYRANMKHGVSEVHQGQRNTLGIIFHDAIS